MSANETRRPSSRLARADWVDAARTTLIRSGVNRVRVLLLAQQMQTTTGSFYWHFKSRDDLLAALLQDWQERTRTAFQRACENAQQTPQAQLEAVANVWISAKSFDPSYDGAIRDWARTSKPVERLVRRVDEQRIELLQKIFASFGFDPARAFVRARFAYFSQVGYYTLRISESSKQRRQILPLYYEVLTFGAPRLARTRKKSR
jgi:AcrR family transcriptional regulator